MGNNVTTEQITAALKDLSTKRAAVGAHRTRHTDVYSEGDDLAAAASKAEAAFKVLARKGEANAHRGFGLRVAITRPVSKSYKVALLGAAPQLLQAGAVKAIDKEVVDMQVQLGNLDADLAKEYLVLTKKTPAVSIKKADPLDLSFDTLLEL